MPRAAKGLALRDKTATVPQDWRTGLRSKNKRKRIIFVTVLASLPFSLILALLVIVRCYYSFVSYSEVLL